MLASRPSSNHIPWEAMNWDMMALWFNTRFEGRVLPGVRERRVRREAEELRGMCGRFKELRQLRGEVGGWVGGLVRRIKQLCGMEV